jgi:hypothetical protein
MGSSRSTAPSGVRRRRMNADTNPDLEQERQASETDRDLFTALDSYWEALKQGQTPVLQSTWAPTSNPEDYQLLARLFEARSSRILARKRRWIGFKAVRRSIRNPFFHPARRSGIGIKTAAPRATPRPPCSGRYYDRCDLLAPCRRDTQGLNSTVARRHPNNRPSSLLPQLIPPYRSTPFVAKEHQT